MRRLILFILFTFISSSAIAGLESQTSGDRVLGNPKAKVTIIEYASLSCPHCAEFHKNILPAIKKEYIETGKVKFIYRDFPLNAPALLGAQVAHCVAKQSGDQKFFEFIETLFEKQKEWAFDKEFKQKLSEIAKNNGMKDEEINDCINKKEYETEILNSRKEATDKLGVKATPHFLINGEKAEGMNNLESARKAIDTVLSGKSLHKAAKEAMSKASEIRKGDFVLGKKKAPVTVIEYSNISCAHCGQFHMELLSKLEKDYIDKGKVKYTFRELPLNQGAFYAYMIARCTGEKDFYKTLSSLISETSTWTASHAFIKPLKAIAQKNGIDGEKFYACLENDENEKLITSTSQEALRVLGINHSPTVLVNGKAIDAHHGGIEAVINEIKNIIK